MTNEERYQKYIEENCMKYKCGQCRYNKRCEKEENKYEIQNKQYRVDDRRSR